MLIRPATPADIPGLYQLALAYDPPGVTAPFHRYSERVAERRSLSSSSLTVASFSM